MTLVKPKPFVKGTLELLALVELKHAPQSGKGLAQRVKMLTDGNWKPSPGTLYPTLRRLEARKCIRPVLDRGPGRREIKYALTVKGEREIIRNRSAVLNHLQEVASLVMPLSMRMLHEFDDEELKELTAEMKKIDEVMRRVFALPPEKRRLLIKAVFKTIASLAGNARK